MAMITRCPSCTTMFKVVPDQLRISDGWVKCGMCVQIFDASQHLFHATIQTPPSESPAPPATASATTSAIAHTAPLTPLTPTLSAAFEDIVLSTGSTSAAHPVVPPVSFLREPAMEAPRHRPVARSLLWALAIMLALCLPAQWVYVERNQLAALYPQLQPSLQSLCIPLQCTLSAPMQIESWVIDSAGFDHAGPNGYRLGFTLKNASQITLALPVVELTLTDFADQPIIRRVLTHADLGVTTPTLAAGADWQVALAMNVTSEPSWPKVLGYRLMAFYP